ncbi:hypothetical protein [Paraburkholderia caledonica]|uniref:hypothetical protein n=1 Tax=Paraburkholderia caledonica TaxID=134536 RepID=UPI000B402310|nr:hypothetical protein [Paraburkholderia caledonica]
MNKIVAFTVIAMAAVVSQMAQGSEGSSESECNPFPKTDGSDIQTGGSLELNGLGKLAGGKVRGDYSKNEKRLLADGPDANRTEVVMALLAYHCRRVKGLSPVERAKADQQFYEVVKALSASESKAQPDAKHIPKASAAVQAKSKEPAIAPSAKQAASLLKIAARKYKSAMGLPFTAALGGAYVPVVPYELLTDKTMLSMVANQKLMEPVPNTDTVPEDDTESLAYGMCRGVQDGDKQVNDAMMRYGSKIPERLYADIGGVRDTTIYKYFDRFITSGNCDVFLGVIRNRMDQKLGKIRSGQIAANWPIPVDMPSFSVEQFSEYVAAIKTLDIDASYLDGTQKVN